MGVLPATWFEYTKCLFSKYLLREMQSTQAFQSLFGHSALNAIGLHPGNQTVNYVINRCGYNGFRCY